MVFAQYLQYCSRKGFWTCPTCYETGLLFLVSSIYHNNPEILVIYYIIYYAYLNTIFKFKYQRKEYFVLVFSVKIMIVVIRWTLLNIGSAKVEKNLIIFKFHLLTAGKKHSKHHRGILVHSIHQGPCNLWLFFNILIFSWLRIEIVDQHQCCRFLICLILSHQNSTYISPCKI